MFGIDDAVGAGLKLVTQVIDRVIPDPAAAAAAKLELLKLNQTGELAQLSSFTDLAKGQLAVNQAEASTGSLFIGGWRPFIGWVCGFGFAFQFLVGPLASWIAFLCGKQVPFPTLDIQTLLALVSSMLGIGIMRTIEKKTGTVDTEPSRAGQQALR